MNNNTELIVILLENIKDPKGNRYQVRSYQQGEKLTKPSIRYRLQDTDCTQCLTGVELYSETYVVDLFARNIQDSLDQKNALIKHVSLYSLEGVTIQSIYSNQDPETDGTIIHHTVVTIKIQGN